jgi:DNA polymerase III delta subunit
MIYIVHGDDYAKSRRLVLNQQKKLALGLRVEKETEDFSPRELYETACSFDIFGNPPFIVLNIPHTKLAEADDYIKVMQKIPKESVLIILCERELGRTNAFYKNAAKLKAKVVLNNQPQTSNIFKFVDSVFFKNKNTAYEELEKLTEEGADTFYLLSMLLYGLRNVAHAKFSTVEFAKKSNFVREKSLAQAEHYTQQDIRDMFNLMYQTDKKLKTGLINQEVALVYTMEKILNT